jgi:hypothetical protein
VNTIRAAILGAVAVFALTRFLALERLPVFVDEARQMMWARAERVQRPMVMGKALQVWAITPLMNNQATSDLRWARAASGVAGCLALWTTYELGRRVGSGLTGALALWLYTLCPFTLFYDRMALGDVHLAAFAGLSALAAISVAAGSGNGIWLGVCLGLSVLSKATGVLALLSPLAAAGLLRTAPIATIAKRLLTAYSICVALAGYPFWLFVRRGIEIEQKSSIAGIDPGKIVSNSLQIGTLLWSYWTPPVAVLVVVASLAALLRRDRLSIFLLFVAAVPLLFVAFGARTWYPRYVLFGTAPALVLAADLSSRVARRASHVRGAVTGCAVGGVALLVPAMRFDEALLRDPSRAPLPTVERFQYVEGWPSGYGTVEAFRYVQQTIGKDEATEVVFHTWADQAPLVAFRAYALADRRIAVVDEDLSNCDTDPRPPGAQGHWALRGARPAGTDASLSNPAVSRHGASAVLAAAFRQAARAGRGDRLRAEPGSFADHRLLSRSSQLRANPFDSRRGFGSVPPAGR